MSSSFKSFVLSVTPGFAKPWWERLENSPIGYRLARGAFWSLIGTAASRVFVLGASVLAARLLGKEGFGELGIIQSTIGMFGAFAGFGLGLTASKHVAEFRTTNPERAGRILRMSALMCWFTGGLIGLVLAISAPWLASSSLAAPHLTNELRLSALYLLFATVNGGQMGALAGFEAFRRIASVNLWLGGMTLLFLPLGCWVGGLMGGVYGLIAAQGICCLISWYAILEEAKIGNVPMRLAGWTTELQLLWRFSLPTALTGLLGMPVAWICQALLARQPGGYEQVADYYSSMQLRNIPLAMVGVLVSAILPVYANARATEGIVAQKKVLRLTRRMIFVTIFPLLLAMAIFAEPMLLAYGRDFQTGSMILRLLLLSVAFEAVANTQVQVMIGNGQISALLSCYLMAAIVFISLGGLLIPRALGAGLAAAIVSSQFVRWLTTYLYLRRFTPPYRNLSPSS